MNKNLRDNLFAVIEQLVSGTCIIFSRGSLSQKLSQLDVMQGVDNRSINRCLKRFKEQGLIKTLDRSGRSYFSLTDKGIRKLTDFRLKNRDNQKWDGLWRVVIFDIPEDKKIVRDALRRRLKYFNFYPLQKSVFVTPANCEEEINDLADFFQVSEYLYTLLAKSLGPKDEEVRDFFKEMIKK